MIRELLTPEAQPDPYVWAAVLLAHAVLGVAAWALIGWWAVVIYAAFEFVQAVAARCMLWWDSVLDTCGFTCGALLAAALWARSLTVAAAAILICGCIALAGICARSSSKRKDPHG